MSREQAVSIKQLSLSYPNSGTLLFEDLSIDIYSGEKVLLLGPSGSGKSTLAHMMAGLIPSAIELPYHAEALVPAKQPAIVFQDPDTQFCMPYVDEEIAFVLENRRMPRDQMDVAIERLLAQVGLDLPERHWPIAAMSQGMKQRLAIACALAAESDVLFLDEPTALLDPEGTTQIWQTVRQACSGKTIIIIEHKISEIIDFVDRIVLFNEEGQLLDDGAPQELFQRYRRQLDEYGIWHPYSWKNYLSQYAPGKIKQKRHTPLLLLNHWAAYRGKQRVGKVDGAVVHAGDWVCITGKNGAGKSSFLYALMNLLKWKGTYQLNGEAVKQKQSLSEQIGFVFQNPEFQFVADSVWQELLAGCSRESANAQAQSLLEMFQLAGKQDNHPYMLSIGQKRRLSVATAFMEPRPLLLFDEPTFGQDAKNTFLLLEALEERRRQGTAILMVTHDEMIVDHFATHEWTIKNGTLDTIMARTRNGTGGDVGGIQMERDMA
ncbi:ABC transporter ATP-binding protein [Shouchella clausii]|uniref:ABC transporter ATP-binding protein n=1 Tax=Shouchella clausii TaxID=79880 RepID=UPI000BA6A47E|nr:ABC transporter ATP-binding protein [Shouchella clausii]PAD48696.1 ABC transporter [Shouchella clausii]